MNGSSSFAFNLRLLGLGFAILVLASCHKDEIPDLSKDWDSITFGYYFGECGGEECVEIFKLEKSQLSEDSLDHYPHGPDLITVFVPLSQDKFELAKALPVKIPRELYALRNQTIGCPDCGDWGGLYLQWNGCGERYYWQIDNMNENLPAFLIPFKEEMMELIRTIQ